MFSVPTELNVTEGTATIQVCAELEAIPGVSLEKEITVMFTTFDGTGR